MTSVPWTPGPDRHPDPPADIAVDGGRGGLVRPEVFRVLLTSGSNPGEASLRFATQQDRTTATRSAQPR